MPSNRYIFSPSFELDIPPMATATKSPAKAAKSTKTEQSPLERKIQFASNTTVGIVNRILPITKKDGTPVEGGSTFTLGQSVEVNFGTKEKPNYQRVDVQESWFTAWDNGTPKNPNPVSTNLNAALKGKDWAVLRLYWDFDGRGPSNVYEKEIMDRTAEGDFETVLDPATGLPKTKRAFRYAPNKRVFHFEVLSSGVKTQTNNEEVIPY